MVYSYTNLPRQGGKRVSDEDINETITALQEQATARGVSLSIPSTVSEGTEPLASVINSLREATRSLVRYGNNLYAPFLYRPFPRQDGLLSHYDMASYIYECIPTFENAVNCSAAGAQLQKTGSNNAWDAYARSVECGQAGSFLVSFSPCQISTCAVALGTASQESDLTAPHYQLRLAANGTATVYEDNVSTEATIAYESGDIFRIEASDSRVRYYHQSPLTLSGTLLHSSDICYSLGEDARGLFYLNTVGMTLDQIRVQSGVSGSIRYIEDRLSINRLYVSGSPQMGVEGQLGQCIEIDGEQRLDFAVPISSAPLSISLRHQFVAHSDYQVIIGARDTFKDFLVAKKVDGVYYLGTRDGEELSTFEIKDGFWYHLVATQEEDTFRLFVDSNLLFTTEVPLLANNPIFSIGGNEEGNNGYGKYDDIRIYQKALSIPEVVAIGQVTSDQLTASFEAIVAETTKIRARHLEEVRQVVDDAAARTGCNHSCAGSCGVGCDTVVCRSECGSNCASQCSETSCTITCSSKCITSCVNGYCGYGCASSCRTTCVSGCSGDERGDPRWSSYCLDTCIGGCDGLCGYTCTGHCDTGCYVGCGEVCSGGECGTSCSGTCFGATCTNPCFATCNIGCGVSCTGSSCRTDCQGTCELNCYNSCMEACASSCSESARIGTPAHCVNSCTSTCIASCDTVCKGTESGIAWE